MTGRQNKAEVDIDEFDSFSDHLAIFDKRSQMMVATCRLNCSLFSSQFYTSQEFNCDQLLSQPGVKIELGRVCVHSEFRKGIIVILLWKAFASYMKKTNARFLFGCGSVSTTDPKEALLLCRYLEKENKMQKKFHVEPKGQYRSEELDLLLRDSYGDLSETEIESAQKLLPPLCRSYFDIGCFTPGLPAFDHEFKCIDFLTVLDVNELDPKVRRKMF
jgi:putative hemolysin